MLISVTKKVFIWALMTFNLMSKANIEFNDYFLDLYYVKIVHITLHEY